MYKYICLIYVKIILDLRQIDAIIIVQLNSEGVRLTLQTISPLSGSESRKRARPNAAGNFGGDHMALKRMSIKISEDLHNYIHAQAQSEGLSMNAVIIFALNNYRMQNSVFPNIESMNDILGKLENVKSQK